MTAFLVMINYANLDTKMDNENALNAAVLEKDAVRPLEQYDFIETALLFGSYAEGSENKLSDIDIAILTTREISLLELGRLTAYLEGIFKREIDIVVLNNLQIKNPVLAHEIATKGKLLFCRDMEKFIAFKTQAIITFMDTAPLREAVNRAIRRRLKNGRFGDRNYAG